MVRSSIGMAALSLLCNAAIAISYHPYEVYPYVQDATDNPPLYFTKVCEPGVSGEANASYIVFGCFFPRTYQAVAS